MALEDDLKKIKELPPLERLEAIRNIEKKKKEELNREEEILKKAQQETISEAEDMQNQKVQIPVPQMRATTADVLETEEAKILWATKQGVQLKRNIADVALEASKGKREDDEVDIARAQKQLRLSVAHYSDIVGKLRKESNAAIEAYKKHEPITKSDEEYQSLVKKDLISESYQKPEPNVEGVLEQRSATPGTERQTQDFYTTETKKRR
jgi:hypothetical protein